VALEPPDPVRRRLAAIQERLRREAGRHADDVRWVTPSNIHLTLQFLGAVPEERVPDICAAIAEVAASSRPLRLELRGAGGFPSPRRPRVIFTGLAGDLEALGGLVAKLGQRLGPLGFAPDERTSSPHLTQGRARDRRGAPGLGGALAGTSSDEAVPWRVNEIVLFRSHLSPAGARYEALGRWRLGEATS
jgi:2'-5' RNA ligase